MNRADLNWALNAVLPHAGRSEALGVVGLVQRDGKLYAYATDRYTIGVARIDCDQQFPELHLSRSEATDLMRFVRPTKVATNLEAVEVLHRDGELHVALPDDSAVFETRSASFDLDDMLGKVEQCWNADIGTFAVLQPRYFERFSKAGKVETDQVWVYACELDDVLNCAVVAVGDDFVGAVMGIASTHHKPGIVQSFLQKEGAAA